MGYLSYGRASLHWTRLSANLYTFNSLKGESPAIARMVANLEDHHRRGTVSWSRHITLASRYLHLDLNSHLSMCGKACMGKGYRVISVSGKNQVQLHAWHNTNLSNFKDLLEPVDTR